MKVMKLGPKLRLQVRRNINVDSNPLSIKPTLRLKTNTSYKPFYDTVVDKKRIFATKYQLYTYAIMVAIIKEATPDKCVKNVDICQVVNAKNETANFEVAQGLVAHLSPDITTGEDLIKRMNEYADAGISILQSEYLNNNEELDISSFID